ncbi:MAG: hypothetical protein ACI38A_00260 [Candidatus Ornithomonoglobus sp.]
MTKEFAEYVNRMAKGMNFDENVCILSVGEPRGDMLDITTTFNGSADKLISVIDSIIREFLKQLDDDMAYLATSYFKGAIEDEERRRTYNDDQRMADQGLQD